LDADQRALEHAQDVERASRALSVPALANSDQSYKSGDRRDMNRLIGNPQ
jgi:hypothetical protein